MVTKEVPKPKILQAQDAIVRVTTAAICGSDLHIYHGILGSTEVPRAMGHEAMGIVVETGSAVTSVKEGDRVVISAGQTRAQEPGQLQLEPSIGGGFDMFGGGKDFGSLEGTQGMKLSFYPYPHARLRLTLFNYDTNDSLSGIRPSPPGRRDPHENRQPPDPGQGIPLPVRHLRDRMASPRLRRLPARRRRGRLRRGARRAAVRIQRQAARRQQGLQHPTTWPRASAKARSIGSVPIDFTKGGGLPSAQMLRLVPDGVTRVCDCVDYECVDERLKPDQGFVLNEAVKMASDNGGIGVAGVYLGQPNNKGTPRAGTVAPDLTFPMTLFWGKSLSMKGRVVDILKIVPMLFELVKNGIARPGFIVSEEYVGLDQAPEAYRRFDQHKETKVLCTFPWHKVDNEEGTSADEEDTALGREHDGGGELDPHGADTSTR